MRTVLTNPVPLALIIFLTVFAGCGTLPNVSKMAQEVQDSDPIPEIVDSKGQLSLEKRTRIIEHLEAQAHSADLLDRQIALMDSISGSLLTSGNKVTLFMDAPAVYDAMFQAIRDAKDHVNLEVFIFNYDQMGKRMANLLLEKRSEGVEINLIYDSAGSFTTTASFFKRLRDGGVRVLEFNPIRLGLEGDVPLTERDHRKILVVDGKIAFTGGVNISRRYWRSLFGKIGEGEKQSRSRWRDTHLKVEGPAVAEFQRLFLDTWKRQKGPELGKRYYFPHLENRGDALVRVVGSTPGEGNRLAYIMYVAAILFSERSVHLTNAYFAPDEGIINALTGAAKRGVDVKIILPRKSDHDLLLVAGRSYYTSLLEGGVKLYERRDALLHAKTAVIDGIWSTVGSTNMEFWSFLRDDEVEAVVIDPKFAEKMEELFDMDLRASEQIYLDEWEKRPLAEWLSEWFVRFFAYWL